MKNIFLVRSISAVLLSLCAPSWAAPAASADVQAAANSGAGKKTDDAKTAQPIAPKPPTAKPSVVEPAVAKPAVAKASVTPKSAVAKPTVAKPPVVKPPTAKPATPKPPDIKPTPTIKAKTSALPSAKVAVPAVAPKKSVAAAPVAIGVLPSLRDLAASRKLSNGAMLVTRLDRTSPRVAISLLVRASAADETVANAGWRRIMTEAMLRASLAKTGDAESAIPASRLQRLVQEVGGTLGASVSDDAIEFWATGDARNADALLDALLLLATQPRLSDADIAGARRRVGAAGVAAEDDVAQSATSALRAQVYRSSAGQILAYGLAPYGTEESRRNLTDARVRALSRAYLRPEMMVVGASGAIDATALAARLEKLAPPPAKSGEAVAEDTVSRPSPPVFANVAKAEPTLLVRQLPTDKAWVFVSYLGAKTDSADMPALAVLAALLGEAPNARLPRRLLSTRTPSLGGPPDESAQLAAVSFVPRRWGSEFVIYAQTEAGAVESVKNALLDEARKLRETPVAIAELTRAKNYVRGSWSVDREPLRERSFNAALALLTNSSPDWEWANAVQKVTPADVRRVAQKTFAGYAVALIMPQS